MALGEVIDGLIEPFSPRAAFRRRTQRMALKELRAYDAAAHNRRTQGWRRTNGSADREVKQGLVTVRNGARELVRNDKVAAAAVRQVVAHMIGDGIATRAVFPADPEFAQKAQDAWDRWADGRVDGRHDWYGVQKLSGRAIVEGGEVLHVWAPDKDGPDGRVIGMEGDFLDHSLNLDGSGKRIVQGVEYDNIGDRAAYHVFDRHPGDGFGYAGKAIRMEAQHVDHIFEELRWGQSRGMSWLGPLAMDMRDLADTHDAVRVKRKIEACLALVLTSTEAGGPNPFGEIDSTGGTPGAPGAAKKPDIETLRAGMIYRARPGESATTVNPSSSGDGVEFSRMEMMGFAANLAPYHLISGDPGQANYSSLRAMNQGFHADLDDWQQNMVVPLMCDPAFYRRMRREALRTGDKRYLQVRAKHAMPIRRNADPLKDYAAELAEIRGGTKSLEKALAERGLDLKTHLETIAATQKLIQELGLVLECDPSRTTQSGLLQAASSFVFPRQNQD